MANPVPGYVSREIQKDADPIGCFMYHLKQMNVDGRNERVLIQISWVWLIRINEGLYQRKSDEITEVQIYSEVI